MAKILRNDQIKINLQDRYMNSVQIIIISTIAVLMMVSCSTTRVLQDGEYRLTKNKIEIANDDSFNPSRLNKYLKQNEGLGWSPFMVVYNWSDMTGSKWDNFLEKIGKAPVVYDPDMVDSSIENITNHLEYLGYYGSRVESDISVKRKRVTVTYDVFLGKRFPIKAIDYVLPSRGDFRDVFLKDTAELGIHPGDYLSEDALESITEEASSRMRNQGFFDFSKNNFFFEADTTTYPDSAILELRINEYTRNESPKDAEPIRRFYIDDVTISYPKSLKINNRILKDLNTVIPGDIYSENMVNNTYSRFSELRLFSSVNIGMTAKDTNLVDCSISLTQSKLQGFKVNLEGSTNSSGLLGVSPQLSYYHKNIFRGGEWLNMSFMGNFQFKFNDNVRSNEFGVSAGLSLPRFFPLSYRYFKGAIPRTDVNFSYNYQNRPEYTRNIISTSYGYTGNVDNRFYYQVYPMQLNVVRLFDLEEDFYDTLVNDPFLRNAYQDHFDLGSGGMLYYTTSPAAIPDHTYFYSRLQLDIAGNLLRAFNPLMKKDANGSGMIWNTPYSQYVRAELTLGRTWVWGKSNGQSIATRLLAGAGYAYGNSSALPFEKHFYGGGANSLRGWQARTVGPGTAPLDKSFVIPNQTGDMKIEANIEYRFDMFWKLAGALFVDAGNVWTLRHGRNESTEPSMFSWNNLGESIAADWGVGLRLDFSFLLLRFDMGMKIHDPAREQKWVNPGQWLKRDNFAVHFGVGYPF